MKESQLSGVVVCKERYEIWVKGTAGLSGDETSSIGAGCAAPHAARFGRDIRCRIADSGISNLASKFVRVDPHRSIKSATACLSSGLGFSLRGMSRRRDRRFDGDMVESITNSRGAYSPGRCVSHTVAVWTRRSVRIEDTKEGR